MSEWMKIRVQTRDGAINVLSLAEPLYVERGEQLNCLSDSTSTDYLFTQDGFYHDEKSKTAKLDNPHVARATE